MSSFRDYDYETYAAVKGRESAGFNDSNISSSAASNTVWPSEILLPKTLPVDTLVHVA